MPWTQGAHPLEAKKVCADGHLVQLRFEPGFEDPNWCTTGHTFFVQAGVLHLVLEDALIEVLADNGLVLTHGTAHKAANRGDEPLILLAIQHEIRPR